MQLCDFKEVVKQPFGSMLLVRRLAACLGIGSFSAKNVGPASLLRGDPAFTVQQAVSSGNSIKVNAKHRGQHANSGELVIGLQLPAVDQGQYALADLPVDRLALCKINLNIHLAN